MKFHNNTNFTIKIPKQIIVSDKDYIVNNVKAEIVYVDDDPGRFETLACHIDPSFEIDEKGLVSLGMIQLAANQDQLKSVFVHCYSFAIGKYNIRFVLDSDRTGLYGMTDWVSFDVVK